MSTLGRSRPPAERASIARGLRRYTARQRAIAAQLGPGYRLFLRGVVTDTLRPFVAASAEDLLELVRDAGGAERCSTARRLLLEETASLLVGLRAERARYAATGATDALDRVVTLSNAVRSLLVAAGLDPVRAESDPLDVDSYRIAARAAHAQDANAQPPDTSPVSVDDRASCGDLASETKAAAAVPAAADDGGDGARGVMTAGAAHRPGDTP